MTERLNKLGEVVGAMTERPWRDDEPGAYVFQQNLAVVAEMRGFGAGLDLKANARGITLLRNIAPELIAVAQASKKTLERQTDPHARWAMMEIEKALAALEAALGKEIP